MLFPADVLIVRWTFHASFGSGEAVRINQDHAAASGSLWGGRPLVTRIQAGAVKSLSPVACINLLSHIGHLVFSASVDAPLKSRIITF